MKYYLNKIGEGWRHIPKEEWKQRMDYENLYHKIKRREKKIKSDVEKLKKLKHQLIDWKKERTIKYNELIKYHKEISPTISITFGKTPKIRTHNANTYLNPHNEFYTNGNRSWNISMRIKGIPKTIYIGTTKDVCRRLDELEGTEKWKEGIYTDLFPHEFIPHEKKIKTRIKELVVPNIIEELVEIRDRDGNVDEFIKRKKIKGIGYLMEPVY